MAGSAIPGSDAGINDESVMVGPALAFGHLVAIEAVEPALGMRAHLELVHNRILRIQMALRAFPARPHERRACCSTTTRGRFELTRYAATIIAVAIVIAITPPEIHPAVILPKFPKRSRWARRFPALFPGATHAVKGPTPIASAYASASSLTASFSHWACRPMSVISICFSSRFNSAASSALA